MPFLLLDFFTPSPLQLTNWGLYPRLEARLLPADAAAPLPEGSWIPRGMGRCYGDSALAPQVLDTRRMNRLLAFDAETGELYCEAGVTFADLLQVFVPRGWFPPVTPGTKFVSLGGAFASDVHGKNHHLEGSFSRHVQAIELRLAGGQLVLCSREENPELFWATAGGMGLTGLIVRLRLKLKPIETTAIRSQTFKARGLEESLALFDRSDPATYSVAWIDTLARGKALGRSLLMQGEHATRAEVAGTPWEKAPLALPRKLQLSIPFPLPGFVLNRFNLRAFNWLYYHRIRKPGQPQLSSYEGFFYPLDAIHHWNRIYGRRGFTQYQFVVPRTAGHLALQAVLQRCQQAGFGSFLSVLKLFGPADPGYLSFPRPGYTLTLDFPISPRLFPLLDTLDALVLDHGGRVYLTKDVRLPAHTFRQMYPQYPAFLAIKRQVDPENRLLSHQAQRLGIEV